MTDPDRAARMWVVVAVTTLWLVEVGGLAEFEPRPETIPQFRAASGKRLHRLFRVGLGLILAGLLAGNVLGGGFIPEEWPKPYPDVTEKGFQKPTYPTEPTRGEVESAAAHWRDFYLPNAYFGVRRFHAAFVSDRFEAKTKAAEKRRTPKMSSSAASTLGFGGPQTETAMKAPGETEGASPKIKGFVCRTSK